MRALIQRVAEAGVTVDGRSTGAIGPGLLVLVCAMQGDPDDAPEKLAAREAEYKARFANPFVAGSRGYIDDVIQPHETRKRICRSLAMLKDKKLDNPWRKHGNIPL